MTPAVFNFKPQYKGNTFKGVRLTLTNRTDGVTTPIDLTGVLILMQLKKSHSSAVIKEFTTISGITVVDAVNGIITIDKFMITIDPFLYLYDIQLTFSNADVTTYMTGTFLVKQNLV